MSAETAYFLTAGGEQVSASAYYARMIGVAQQRQRAFRPFSASRRRWKAHERRYRLLQAQADRAAGSRR